MLIDSRPRTGKPTLDLGGYLHPWILVKQCSRPGGSAIQPILAAPGQSATQAKPLASPRASNMRSKGAKMDLKRHALEPPMGDKWLAIDNPWKHRIVVSSNPEIRGRQQGAKPSIFAAPRLQGAGRAGLTAYSDIRKRARVSQMRPAPAAGPSQK